MLPFPLVVMLAKFITFIIKVSGRGAGATWPGEIALRIRPIILQEFIQQAKEKQRKVIYIAGTNGKTTTSKMLETIFHSQQVFIVRNTSGANLDNGIVSCFIASAHYTGELLKDIYIFEVDEATLPHVLKAGTPHVLVLMNLFRDQLDRYGEVDSIAEKWLHTLFACNLSQTTIVINGDDPHLAAIGELLNKKSNVVYFGLNNPELFLPEMQHATDSIFCPSCGNRLTFGGVYFSHLGKYACGRCGFKHPHMSLTAKEVESPIKGIYNIYNTLAASLTATLFSISLEDSQQALKTFSPAFGRMETLIYKGKQLQVLLSKNPTGWNESIRTLLSANTFGPLVLVLNDRIPDGRDISWIYDVDYEQLSDKQSRTRIVDSRKKKLIHSIDETITISHIVKSQKIIVTGDRAYDLATRLIYADVSEKRLKVEPDVEKAIEIAVQATKENQILSILPTYSAMLEVRKILTGKKIE